MLLQNLQVEFAESIMNADQSVSSISPPQHISIYRNNVTTNFMNVLKDTYPLIYKLLGDDYFRVIAKEYINQYPSCSSNLHDYGEYFGAFLAELPSLKQLVYLNEVAQFEWASHKIFFAADHPEFNSERLKSLSPDQYSTLHFTLHPASELIKFNFPILKIIDLCKGLTDDTININEGGVNLLIIRRDLDIKLAPLMLSEFNFLKALQNNLPFSSALKAALDIDASFNLEEKLLHWIKNKTIVDCYLTSF